MVKKLYPGKYYAYKEPTKTRPSSFADGDEMNFMLTGIPFRCISTNGDDSASFAGTNQHSWSWILKDLKEVDVSSMPVKYVVTWDTEDSDPAMPLFARSDLDVLLPLLVKDDSVITGTIRVFKVSDEMEYKTRVELVSVKKKRK